MFGIGLGFVNGAAFTPFSVSGMHSYYSADVCTNGSGVATAIQDQSKNHENALVTFTGDVLYSASDSNFNNKPSFGCVAAARTMQVTFNTAITQPSTYYLVMDVISNANTVYWRTNQGNFTDSAGFYITPGNSGFLQTLDAGSAISTPAITAGNYVSCAIYDGAATTALYLNNSGTAFAIAPTDGSVDPNSNTVMTMGTFTGQEADYYWTTAIQYNGTHDAATRKKIMTYLGTKYGITTT